MMVSWEDKQTDLGPRRARGKGHRHYVIYAPRVQRPGVIAWMDSADQGSVRSHDVSRTPPWHGPSVKPAPRSEAQARPAPILVGGALHQSPGPSLHPLMTRKAPVWAHTRWSSAPSQACQHSEYSALGSALPPRTCRAGEGPSIPSAEGPRRLCKALSRDPHHQSHVTASCFWGPSAGGYTAQHRTGSGPGLLSRFRPVLLLHGRNQGALGHWTCGGCPLARRMSTRGPGEGRACSRRQV